MTGMVSINNQKNNMPLLRFLGVAGGLSAGCETTCFQIGTNVLIDAGTGIGQLSVDEMLAIDHVFLTHSHLDHVCGLAFLADIVCGKRKKPIHVYGLEETLQAVRTHLFNDVIWPDFSILPSAKAPTLCWHPLSGTVQLQELLVHPFPAEHATPATGYLVEGRGARWLISGDTCISPEYIARVRAAGKLDAIVMECAFPDALEDIARLARHTFVSDFKRFVEAVDDGGVSIWITHMKPGAEDLIKSGLFDGRAAIRPRIFFAETERQLIS